MILHCQLRLPPLVRMFRGVNLGTTTMTSGQPRVNPQDGTIFDDIAQQTATVAG